MYCNSYKNKSSTTRCSAKSLVGSQFCGRHIRLKNPRMWVDNDKQLRSAIKIQKIWRGYSHRRMMRLLGSKLRKVEYANTEDLFTFDDAAILDKFEFSENGTNWWFDISTIHDWSYRSINPCNPYTKEPIDIETRKRMREVVSIRRIRSLKTSHVEQLTTENKFVIICQILEENGLELIPNSFLALTSFQLTVVLNFLELDLREWHRQKRSEVRRGFHYLIHQFLTQQYAIPLDYHQKLFANCILYMFRHLKNPYPICFMVVSAIYRV